MTANLKTLWQEEAPPYLRGVPDEYCNTGAHYGWMDVIDSSQLANALRSDSRTDVGRKIRNLSVARYDETGRAELVSLSGDRMRTISGWEFKLIVGRALGWNVLKSSRFSVSRSGSRFVFRGGGFGHGLGLCQEGSHVMAQRGQSFQQILAHYFPGTSVDEYRSAVGLTRLVGQNTTLAHVRAGTLGRR
jgi:stage II sporulation protein D